jgi:hypothetical protein
MISSHPLTRFETFCALGRARRAYREAVRLFDPIQPERAGEYAAEVARLERLLVLTGTHHPRCDRSAGAWSASADHTREVDARSA